LEENPKICQCFFTAGDLSHPLSNGLPSEENGKRNFPGKLHRCIVQSGWQWLVGLETRPDLLRKSAFAHSLQKYFSEVSVRSQSCTSSKSISVFLRTMVCLAI